MSLFSRRRVLQLGGVTLATGLAGCTSVFPQSTTLRVVKLVNEREDTHTVHLLVEYDGELTYWSSFDLSPATVDDGGTIRSDGVALEDEWPQKAGQFVVHARLDDQQSWQSLTLSGQGTECTMVRIHVERTDQPQADLSILASKDCRD